VAASWQTECPAKCLELFQLADLRIRDRLGFAGDGIGLRLFALGFLNSCLPDDGRGRPLRPSINICLWVNSRLSVIGRLLINNCLSVNNN